MKRLAHVWRPFASVRRMAVVAAIPLLAGALIYLSAAWSTHSLAQVAPGAPYWAQTEQESIQQGHLNFSQRPPDVQAVMQRMYDSRTYIQTLSGLFVDHAPGDQPGSLRIFLNAPDTVRTQAFRRDDGTGAPVEVTDGAGPYVTVGAPEASVATRLVQSDAALPPLGSVPLSVMPLVQSHTTIRGVTSGATAWLADLFIHPAIMLTSPFFTAMTVTIDGSGVYQGRPCWMMSGVANPKAEPNPLLGNRWHAVVDRETGIILRLDYYSDSASLGHAELDAISINGEGQAVRDLHSNASLLTRARITGLPQYDRAAQARLSHRTPGQQVRSHSMIRQSNPPRSRTTEEGVR